MAALNLLVLTLFFINSILGDKICDRGDSDCTKRGAAQAYPLFIHGIEDMLESSDPLVVDYINADSAKLKYQLRDAVLVGLKNCIVIDMVLHEQNKTFQYYLDCPYIESNSNYCLSGYIGDMFFEGKGTTKIYAIDYVFKFDGVYEKRMGKDNKEHGFIKSYVLDIDARGNVTFNFKNLFGDDQEKTDAGNKYINEHWMLADVELGTHIRAFMDKFIDHLNDFLGLLPVEQVFPKQA